ncbi:aspartyl protease family protein [Flavisolibacter tropicus]|uniref:PDZ domain-containing protein n=1 Tax=Flavisolibacter tropicus TaxID=1492898 RepID=A0A172TYS3_9BACT|nr:aspartyl protease family protein [Flavisolibacter tropicus]ANE51887.1 hypothetical protein SY85_16700 [Flavisolibacter tropicus]
MRKTSLALLLALLQLFASAQEEFVTPSRFLTRLPFEQLTGGVILMRGCFSTFPDTLNFILDTGSGGISLDSTTTAYFGLKPTPSDKTIRGIGGIRQVSFLNNHQLRLPDLTIDSLNFHINDYELLSSVYGERIDGIIGYSVLSRYILKINFDSSYLEFWTQGAIKYPRGGYMLKPFITTLPVQAARVKDERTIYSRFLYDMGAGLNMMLSTDFIKDSSLLQRKRKYYTKQAEGLGGKIDMQMTVIKEVKLGPYRFRNVPIYVFDDENNITSYPYLGGLIGNDLLRRFNIILNYSRRDFYLVPNKHYAEPFDYSYSGIELYDINGEVVIGDVAKGSPAEAAGLHEGDIVVAIDKSFNQSLGQMKIALQQEGKLIRMIIRRGAELIQKDFKIKSMKH